MILTGNEVYGGNLVLVNRANMYRREAELPLAAVGTAMLNVEAAYMLGKLLRDIGGEEEITAVSGWRSVAEQRRLWESSLNDNGAEFTEKYVALPLHSEHHTALAIDLGKKADSIDFIRPDFPDDGVCGKFRQAAAGYGFILRYPKGKEQITGIAHEPWHFRYVGVPHAEIMTERGFVLEEYTAFLKKHIYGENPLLWGDYEISFLKSCGGSVNIPDSYGVSGNNEDGLILTGRNSE